MQQNKVRSASIRLSTVATTTRQTPKTDFGTVMRNGLVQASNVAVEGLRVAAPFVPGGAIVSAALAGATNSLAANTGGVGGGYGSPSAAIGSTASGLSSAGGGGLGSSYGAGGAMALPGARPGLNTNLAAPATNFAANTGTAAGAGAQPSDAFNQMMTATKQMSEFQASFNLQYLQLQEKIQIDTRQFNLISNIMKTKHDAAKNALNNVR